MKQGALLVIVAVLAWELPGSASSQSSPETRPTPRMEAVAETNLLMQAVNLPNFQGIEKLLREKPRDAEAWKFMRGQALLIAENGNLLMLRPPRNAGEAVWQEHAAALRTGAAKLANVIAERDYIRSRAGLIDLASTCNACHASFRVGARVVPFSDQPDPRPARPAPQSPEPPASPASSLSGYGPNLSLP